MSKQPVIRISHLSKAYTIGMKYQSDKTMAAALKKILIRPFENYKKIRSLKDPSLHDNEQLIWALKDINLELYAGDVLGIIGKNGSGKSTLLKLLSRITYPTNGKIEMAGRASSLLEVGTGFNPELTGRENIFLNGTLLGMTKREVTQRFDEIVAFSGVEKFIDTPVKRYSSGMKVRLAFAVAAHLEPDILIIDEVLAVGDAEFQKKCIGKMQQVASESGRTVLFVSHDMLAVHRLCNRCVLLDKGVIKMNGIPKDTIDVYLKSTLPINQIQHNDVLDIKRVRGNGHFTILNFDLEDGERNKITQLSTGSSFCMAIQYAVKEKGRNPVVILHIKNKVQDIVFSCVSRTSYDGLMQLNNNGTIRCVLPSLSLVPGTYTVDCILKYDSDVTDHIEGLLTFEVIEGDFYQTGKIDARPNGYIFFKHHWTLE